ncbi:MAG: hypothetical protein WCI88_00430 [Chloroflexota bacterium]
MPTAVLSGRSGTFPSAESLVIGQGTRRGTLRAVGIDLLNGLE